MTQYIDLREPPPKRRSRCQGAAESHFTEAAVMIAFASYLLEDGALTVEFHPDRATDLRTMHEKFSPLNL
jgi:hypothetical protein